MKKHLMFLALSCLFVTTSAVADEPKSAPAASAGGKKYGPAGCGLGSIIIGSKSGFTQVFAATTNGTSGNQTFGITSGTSNCADSDGGSASTKQFIEANREALSKEIARGKGESISSLAALAGCEDSKVVGAALQKNFKKIFPSKSAADGEVSDAIVNTLKSDGLSCSKLTG